MLVGTITIAMPYQEASAGLPPRAVIAVNIDIKPGSDTNPINLKSNGVIPVAILGSDTFDVADIDVTTLAFAPFGKSGDTPLHPNALHLEDVNDDGFTDLVTHYRTQDTGITLGDNEACITGELNDGILFLGCDDIVPFEP